MQTQIIPTTFRTAFERVRIAPSIKAHMPVVDHVLNAITSKDKGYIKRNEWNASLTFGTYQKLKAEGVVQ